MKQTAPDRARHWVYPALLANGSLAALAGAGYLFVVVLLPRIVVALDGLRGVGIYDPRSGGDPTLARIPHGPLVWGAALLLMAGAAHMVAGAIGPRVRRSVSVALIILGMLSLVPSSILFGVLAIRASMPEVRRGP